MQTRLLYGGIFPYRNVIYILKYLALYRDSDWRESEERKVTDVRSVDENLRPLGGKEIVSRGAQKAGSLPKL